MKMVINGCYGGFSVSSDFLAKWNDIHADRYKRSGYSFNEMRTDEDFVALVMEMGHDACGYCAELMVVEIPDTATDYRLEEYDGLERVLCVIDGKFYMADVVWTC